MNIELRYFSGTGNSHKILATCKEIFELKGYDTTFLPISDNRTVSEQTDLIGFCFPVYAYDIPRLCRKYLLSLPRFDNPINAFILITAGDPEEAGFSAVQSVKIMKNKGLNVVYSDVVHMPANWTVSMNPPSKEEALKIINSGVAKAKEIGHNILNDVHHHHVFNYPPKMSKLNFYKDYYLFKWLGVSNLWRNFRADDSCDACTLCEKICPTASIKIIKNKPRWTKTCEQCMRCVNYCPKQAIYQTGEGSIKGKNSYYEPSFKPLKMEQSIKNNGIANHK